MNKKIIIVLLAFGVCVSAFSQSGKKGMAPFKITLLNGKTYTYQQLKKNTPTVLIYFSPDCDHCKNFTAELLKHKDELKNRQIVMVTYLPVAEMKPFDSTYHITSMPNFIMGTEGYSFIVRKYYDVGLFPSIYIFNKEMQLVKTVKPSQTPEALVKEILDN